MNFKACYHDSSTNSCTCKNININNSIFTAASNRDFQSLKNIISKDKRKALTLDSYGYTCLHYVSQNNDVKSLEFLLSNISKNTNIDQNTCGCTPLHRGAYAGSYECVKLLLEFGCSVDCIDESFRDGRTALHKAAARFKKESDVFHKIILLLIQHNADQTIRDRNGNLFSDLMKVPAEKPIIDSNKTIIPITTIIPIIKTIIPIKLAVDGRVCCLCNQQKISFRRRNDNKLICTDCASEFI